uniref:Nucleotide sugar dehydrogenase n=1 Tax=Erysipelothrix rhusiopathiae TaxID=1648 RepID=A0A6S6I6G2_ERYRH|nr:nucleotide sugar dehydrogenase [Erysipelothrix rhusiopathiae]
MKINVVGLGYIGLPTSLMLAASGNNVVGTDVNQVLVSTLNNGKVTFEENGLLELYNQAKKSGIEFSGSLFKADMYIVTVPTPYLSETKVIDPSYIISAVEQIMTICEEDTIIVIESTVSPGTIKKYVRPLLLRSNKNVELVHAPERILPGFMINELINNSRTIGADNEHTAETVKQIYKTFCKAEIAITDIETAEMSKVVENTFRDINIAFANELAQICREANLDVYEVIRIANKHPRVNILSPGPGVGGHCISVDPWFLVGDYPNLSNLILQARMTNDKMPRYVSSRIDQIMRENSIDDFKRVGIYGLSYKENVDDVRESPTIQLLSCNEKLSDVEIFDPFISKKIIEQQVFNFEEFIQNKDLVIILVGHSHIIENQSMLSGKIVYDTKNVLEKIETIRL